MFASFSADESVPEFGVRWRGYDRHQVDEYIRAFTRQPEVVLPPAFDVVLRGYDQDEVDRYVQQLSTAPKPPQEEESPPPFVLSVRKPGFESWEYRVPVPMFVITAASIATPVLGGAYVAAMSDDNPAALRVLLPVLAIAALGFILWSVRRSGTYVSRNGIVTYGVYRRTEIRWREIQGIGRKQSPGAETAVIYTRDGEELKLHQLHTRNFLVEHEVLELHAIWKERRGSRWKPIPEVVALMRDGTLT